MNEWMRKTWNTITNLLTQQAASAVIENKPMKTTNFLLNYPKCSFKANTENHLLASFKESKAKQAWEEEKKWKTKGGGMSNL